MFAALSMENQWSNNLSKKIAQFVGLGPVTSPAHQTNIYVSILVAFIAQAQDIFKFLGVNEFLPPLTGIFAEVAKLLCFKDPVICESVIELICGEHTAAFNNSRMEVMVAHEPGGTSVKNMIHWGQVIKSGSFVMYDYGQAGNKLMYNQTTPPVYQLSKINPTVPIALFYGGEDALADPEDVKLIIKSLPSPPSFMKVIPGYSHLDFCWAIDANVQIYQQIISLFKKYEDTNLQSF